jgi:aminopeptidase-like protein
LIVPETIGTVAYLSHNEDLIPKMKGGLFLEMLGLENPHSLQLSFAANTRIDRCFSQAVKESDPGSWTGAFRTIIGNDEKQYNSPGVRVPFLSLSRVLPRTHADAPYREYHSSHDTPQIVSTRRLEESRNLILEMLDKLEQDLIPVNKYKGEVFCSRYGLHVDWYSNPEGHLAFFAIMDHIDGTKSVSEIAAACGISFTAVKHVIDDLAHHGLVEWTTSYLAQEEAPNEHIVCQGR